MATRCVVISEAEPGIVHVSTEVLHDLLTELGWRKVTPTNGGDHEYVDYEHIRASRNAARPPHPATMAGRK